MKRQLNGRPIAQLAAVILILLSIYKIPHFINVTKLEKLGYSAAAIEAIYDKGLRKTIIKNSYYSAYLNQEVTKDDFNKQYLQLYLHCDLLNDDYFNLYDRLKEIKAYTDEELIELFSELDYYELVPLCVYDKLSDLDTYIADCNANNNDATQEFNVTGDYLHPYENVIEIDEPDNVEVYISPKFTLGEYIPEKLSPLPIKYSIDGLYLRPEALEAFKKLCNAAEANDCGIYAVGAYRSSEDQKLLAGLSNSLKAGYSDSQSGLAVSIVASENESATSYTDTKAYSWVKEHAHEYGFITRYPEGKEAITSVTYMPNYLRYVGVDLASAVYASGLSFDEYYMLNIY